MQVIIGPQIFSNYKEEHKHNTNHSWEAKYNNQLEDRLLRIPLVLQIPTDNTKRKQQDEI